MTTPQDIFESDLSAQESSAVNGVQTFLWRGVSYPCLAADLTELHNLDVEGFVSNADLALTARRSVFPDAGSGGKTVPQPNELIVYRGGSYRVASRGTTRSFDDISMMIYLVSTTN